MIDDQQAKSHRIVIKTIKIQTLPLQPFVEPQRRGEPQKRKERKGWRRRMEGEKGRRKEGGDKKEDKKDKWKKKLALNGDGNGETREAAAKRGFAFLLIKPRRRDLRS